MRTPVVVSDCAPLERIVEAERCGVVFRSGDPADFARAALSLRDPRPGRRWASAATRPSAQRYNWDATAGPLVDLYARLAGAAGG